MRHLVPRRWRRACAASMLVLAACVTACGGDAKTPGAAAPAAPGVAGRYRLSHENGASDLVVEEKDGVVTIRSETGTTTGRVVAPGRIEGKEESADGSGSFVMEVEGDRLVARFSMKGPSGETVDLPVLTFSRVTEAPDGKDASSASGERDARLHGHWRYTEARASGGFTMATDYHLELAADGRFATWSRTEGSAGSSAGERVTGRWESKDGVLRLKADGADGWAESRYQVSGDHLLRTYPSGDKEVYERL